MSTLNIDKVIDYLKLEEAVLDMATWKVNPNGDWAKERHHLEEKPKCGTVACIGGTADFIASGGLTMNKEELEEFYDDDFNVMSYESAFEWIIDGIKLDETFLKYTVDDIQDEDEKISYLAAMLFEPDEYNVEPGDDDYITKARAIRVLEHLRDTGKIDWDI